MKTKNTNIINNLNHTSGDNKRSKVYEPVRIFQWVIINGALMWCAWSAVVHGNEGAGRLLAFVGWAVGPMLLVGGATSDEVKASARKKGRSVPAWLSHVTGMLLVGFLVWYGWWWTATAYLLIEIAESIIFCKDSEPCKPNDAA